MLLINSDVSNFSEYGISRSATVVLAYLMKIKNWSFNQALEFLKEKKPDVRLVPVVLKNQYERVISITKSDSTLYLIF